MHRIARHLCFITLILASSTAAAGRYEPPRAASDGWAVADAATLGWNTATLATLDDKVADGTYKKITSLVVADHGRLVFERYFNGGSPELLNDVRSATKSVTAMLVGAAIQRGAIRDVKAPVYAFFPEVRLAHPDARKATITLEDLLTMSSIWECDDENPFSSGNEERMYVTERWLDFALDLPIRGYAPWVTRPKDSPHGRTFSYCTAGSFVAGAVVERATKQPLAAFAHDVLEAPLGITAVRWNTSSEGIGMGGGGTRYRSRDLAKLGQLAVDGGRWQGRPVLPAAWIDAMLTVRAQARDDADYGYQWWRFRFPVHGVETKVWAMSGNGGNYVFVLPERGLVAVVTSQAYNQGFAHPQSQGIFRDIVLAALPR
ncbi:CubicO group peptidase, beta-lactamase class C family [Luteibacter sp. UNC138MFCol5.1]|uniref:serine hydrolase domain-containing protein n=1 Tax=Luteibacter sp. UNC138MFCol5.1 TaxID=1502774 RepID=UPI0008C63F06|nr:serine hydrolase [Luteibacter sp. UNC138MFCol5.1]SEO32912.1 CubicO group peptidase, beta-lactamase class C family [Luteibacter sp. UNC138MFCol5.1]